MAHFHLIERDDGPFAFELRTPDGKAILTSVNDHTTRVEAIAAISQVRALSVNVEHYRDLNTGTGHAFELVDEEGNAVARSPENATAAERADMQRTCRMYAIGAPLRMD